MEMISARMKREVIRKSCVLLPSCAFGTVRGPVAEIENIFHFLNPLQAGQLLANEEPSKIRTISANKLPLEVSFHVAAFATPEIKGFAMRN